MKPIDFARLLLLAALWGGSYLFMRIAAPVLGVVLTIGLRVTLAAAALGIYCFTTSQLPDWRLRWPAFLILGTTNNVIPFLLIASAVVDLNASIAAILNATTPLFTALVATIWLKEPLGWRKLTGVLLGIVGVGILVGWSPLSISSTVIRATLFAVAGAFSYGVAVVYARRTFVNTRPIAVAMGQLWGSTLLLLPLTAISLPGELPPTPVLIAVIALALVSTAFAYLLYFQLIVGVGATQAATVTFLVPIFSLLWGALLLGEPITPGLIIGLGVILLAVWLVLYRKDYN